MYLAQLYLVGYLFLTLKCSLVTGFFLTTHVEHEKRSKSNYGYDRLVKRERVHMHTLVPVRIGLAQRNLDLGHDELMAVSDPGSPRFGKYYTSEQVNEFFKPSQYTINTVFAWIEKHIQPHSLRTSSNKQWIHFDATIKELEVLLQANFYYYHFPTLGRDAIGCDKYKLPKDISSHIDFITPGVDLLHIEPNSISKKRRDISLPVLRPKNRAKLPKTRLRRDAVSTAERCYNKITQSCVKDIYQIHDDPPNGTGSTVGIFATNHSYYNQTELVWFFQNYTKIPSTEMPRYIRVDGAVKAGAKDDRPRFRYSDTEANLDLQAVYPLAYPHTEVIYYQVDDPVYNDQMYGGHYPFSFNTFLDAVDGSYCTYTAFGITGNSDGIDAKYPNPSKKPLAYKGKLHCGKYTPAKVMSFSYGEGELGKPMAYQRRQCSEFKKLGLQGISLLFASGDSGVESGVVRPPKNSCPGHGAKHEKFGLNTPANCPYVTTVGGTLYTKEGNEIGAFESGGGFSNIYPRPDYQRRAVSNFLDKYPPPYTSYNVSYIPTPIAKGRFNRGGRAYPDLSAIEDAYVGVDDGGEYKFGGTSLSTPLIAGMISRINSYRLAEGKSTLGFLNPALYKNTEMFTDIVEGHNFGCHSNGFKCAPGWDPVTGLGTPNYPKMKNYFLSLP